MLERRTFSKLGAGLVVGLVAANVFALLATIIISSFFLFSGELDSAALSERLTVLLETPLATLVTVTAADAIVLLAVWLFARRLPKAPVSASRLSGGAVWILLFSALCVGMVVADLFYYVGHYVNDTFTGLFPLNQSYVPDILQPAQDLPALIFDFVLACVIAPVFEEIIFRKIIAERLRPFGDGVALLVSGMAFGLFHQNFLQMFYAAALGMLFGYVYLRTGKLWTAILLHAIFNLLGGTLPSALHIWGSVWAGPVASVITLAFWGLGIWRLIAMRRSFALDPPSFRFSTPIRGRVIVGNAGAILLITACIGTALFTAWLPVITNLIN